MIREPPGETDREEAVDAGRHPVCQVEALLAHQGFVLFNTRGSHRTYHDASGRVLTIVGPRR